MTTYTITAERENGTAFTDNMTAATASEARKAFREVYRHGKFTITGCEVYAENICATKEQEREALAKIKAIIETLGPGSYLATAFEGTFEDAETNIDYDFGDSMKRRWESEQETSRKLRETIADLQKRVAEQGKALEKKELDERDLRLAISRVKEEESRTITALRETMLTADELDDIRNRLNASEADAEAAAATFAEAIVKYADDPASADFITAVQEHRRCTRNAENTRRLRHRVEAAETAAHNINAGA